MISQSAGEVYTYHCDHVRMYPARINFLKNISWDAPPSIKY